MEQCQSCKSKRIYILSAKCSDCFAGSTQNRDPEHGYVPRDIGMGRGGDYVEFKYCLDCGQIQGQFPLPEIRGEHP